jgi:hypothetical protein
MKSIEQVEKELTILRELFKNNFYRIWKSTKSHSIVEIVIDEETTVEINLPKKYLKFIGLEVPE